MWASGTRQWRKEAGTHFVKGYVSPRVDLWLRRQDTGKLKGSFRI